MNLELGKDFEIIDIEQNPYYEECWQHYYQTLKRQGMSKAGAKRKMLQNPTAIGTELLQLGKGDALLCGLVGPFGSHLRAIEEIIGFQQSAIEPKGLAASVNGLILPEGGNLFLADTFVNENPTAQQLADITKMAAQEVRNFGIEPQIALISHSNYGSIKDASAEKMREVLRLVQEQAPDLIIDGEMHCDVALRPDLRAQEMPDSPLKGAANLLIFPNMETARIGLNLIQGTVTPTTIGPILMGVNKPAHILTGSSSVRRIVNMIAIAAAKAQG